jgi:hypothetical protein
MDQPRNPKQLEESIQRVQDALARGQSTHVDLLKAVLAAAGAHAIDRVSARLQRRLEKDRLREERRERRREARAHALRPKGVAFAAAAIVALVLAATLPNLWWMVFVALVLGVVAGRQFGNALRLASRQRDQEGGGATPEAAVEAKAEPDPVLDQLLAREKRVDATCEHLLAELKSGPKAVRDFVRRPEETVKALRSACHELSRRERELRCALPSDDGARLDGERSLLAARVEKEQDEVARGRLAGALQALDAQLTQRAELATAALRFEAEGTRILYTLENLRTQLLRARSADAGSADVVGAGLHQSLEQMTQEMDAVAEALEGVHRGEGLTPAPMAEIESADAVGPASRTKGKSRG